MVGKSTHSDIIMMLVVILFICPKDPEAQAMGNAFAHDFNLGRGQYRGQKCEKDHHFEVPR